MARVFRFTVQSSRPCGLTVRTVHLPLIPAPEFSHRYYDTLHLRTDLSFNRYRSRYRCRRSSRAMSTTSSASKVDTPFSHPGLPGDPCTAFFFRLSRCPRTNACILYIERGSTRRGRRGRAGERGQFRSHAPTLTDCERCERSADHARGFSRLCDAHVLCQGGNGGSTRRAKCARERGGDARAKVNGFRFANSTRKYDKKSEYRVCVCIETERAENADHMTSQKSYN